MDSKDREDELDRIRAARQDVAGPGVTPAAATPRGEGVGTRIDRYVLLDKLGEGGMGTVWRALQEEPVRREVALKVIKLGMDTDEVLRRFEIERQALAQMDHPHIARVLDGGSTPGGRPFFVMELVEGEPITEFCDRLGLSIPDRLELFAKVCGAIQHAHQKGVIHRDVKPSNVLASLQDGVPVPKVIDFGVAKATQDEVDQRTILTAAGGILGTPDYMAPEQAEPTSAGVDTRADVYSLGVLLYEMLVGRPPFDVRELLQRGYQAVLRAIREETPVRPSAKASSLSGEESSLVAQQRDVRRERLTSTLRGDLDWIVMKALEKDRERRYGSAAEFADDVGRYLRGEAVLATPPSATYLLRKLVSRNRGLFTAIAGMFVLLTLGVAGTTWGWYQSEEARESAARSEDKALRELSRANEVKGVISRMLYSVRVDHQSGEDTALMKRLIDETAAEVRSGDIEDEAVAAELNAILGAAYAGMDHVELAIGHYEESVAHGERSGMSTTDQAIRVALSLGAAYCIGGRYDAGEALILQTLARAEREFGEESIQAWRARHYLAVARVDVGRIAEGEEDLARSCDAMLELLGPDDREVIEAAKTVAQMRIRQGRYEEALQAYRRVSAGYEAILGAEHVRTISAKNGIVSCLLSLRRIDEAEELARALQEIVERKLDPDTSVSLEVRGKLIDVLLSAGDHKLPEAEALAQEMLDITTASFGENDPIRLRRLYALADVAQRRRDFRRADQLFAELLPKAREFLPERNRNLLGQMLNLAGMVKQFVNQREDAAQLLGEALVIQEETQGLEHSDTLGTMTNLGGLHLGLGDAEKAEAILTRALEIERRALGERHRFTRNAMTVLVDAHLAQGDRDAARAQQAELLELEVRFAEEPGAAAEQVHRAVYNLLSGPIPELLDPDRAVELCQAAAERTERKDPQILMMLASSYERAGQLASAITAFEETAALLPEGSPPRAQVEAKLRSMR